MDYIHTWTPSSHPTSCYCDDDCSLVCPVALLNIDVELLDDEDTLDAAATLELLLALALDRLPGGSK